MFVFDALGDVYTCTERAGNRRYAVARVTADGDLEWNGPQRDLWRERSTATLAPCQKCRYGLYCGGGCAALAENLRGNVAVNECDGFARRFRAMVAEAFVGSTKN
jgi:uncharacterized protein